MHELPSKTTHLFINKSSAKNLFIANDQTDRDGELKIEQNDDSDFTGKRTKESLKLGNFSQNINSYELLPIDEKNCVHKVE